MYCNTVRFFRNQGYDEFEGAAFLHPDYVQIGQFTIPKEDLDGPVIVKLDHVANFNIFCMFSWTVPLVGDDKIVIDLESQLGSIEQCKREFGAYAVVVKNTTEFLHRVDHAVTRQGGGFLPSMRGVVRYIDPKTHQSDLTRPLKLPLFKQERFAHQKEYRFILQTARQPARRLCLRIGSIRDIAFCMKTEDVYNSVKIQKAMEG